jgi:hypothetical protein
LNEVLRREAAEQVQPFAARHDETNHLAWRDRFVE